MLSIVHAGLLIATALAGAGRDGRQPSSPREALSARVRPLDPLARALTAQGAARSPAFASLLADLQRGTSLVVYITTRATELATRGAVRFMTRDAWFTYVVVCIDPKQPGDERIAVLAHELRHATEIAAAASAITSENDLRRLYQRIGFDCGRGLESDAAVATQNVVRRDLAHATTRR